MDPLQWRGSVGLSGQARPNYDRFRDVIVALRRDRPTHEVDQFRSKQRISSTVLDPPRATREYLHVGETALRECLDEVTLRHGPGYSPSPGGRMSHHLGRQRVLLDDDVGDAQTASCSQDPHTLRYHACLARGKVDDAVRDDVVDELIIRRSAPNKSPTSAADVDGNGCEHL